jgi:16S rRNA processing protein RimM
MTVDDDALLVVARIARPHGLRGQVVLNVDTDFPDVRFAVGAVLYAGIGDGMRELTVASVRYHKDRPVVGFEGVDRIEDAEALGRVELRARRDALPPLPDGVFFHEDLVGCAVETASGEALGRVVRIEGGTAASLLVVQGRRRELLVPLAEAICVRIDAGAKRIVIEPPEGLLDLN